MQIKKGQEELWEDHVGCNKDGYGKAIIGYAIRWADMYEKEEAEEISGTRKITETFTQKMDRMSHEADTEGITGFMYGCAVRVLKQFWIHGEAVVQWHNGKYGVGPEEKGVVNPAIITIGK